MSELKELIVDFEHDKPEIFSFGDVIPMVVTLINFDTNQVELSAVNSKRCLERIGPYRNRWEVSRG